MVSIEVNAGVEKRRHEGLRRAHRFAAEGLEGDVGLDRDRFVFHVRNTSGAVFHVDWNKSFYVDEEGSRRRIYALEPAQRPSLPGTRDQQETTVAPGGRGSVEIFFVDKTYPVLKDCRTLAVYREPVIPWHYRNLSKETVGAKASSLKGQNRRIALVIDLERDGEKQLWRFTYEIFDRATG